MSEVHTRLRALCSRLEAWELDLDHELVGTAEQGKKLRGYDQLLHAAEQALVKDPKNSAAAAAVRLLKELLPGIRGARNDLSSLKAQIASAVG
jgi:hypothetical protein